MFNFYNISRFKPDYNFSGKVWNDISDVIKCKNDDILSHYLWLEKQHVKFINMFINYFSVDRLGYAIFLEDLKKISSDYFFDMEEPIERINNLSRYNLKILNTNDLNFLLKSWVRGLCYLHFFDTLTGSFIRKTDDFNFLLMLHKNYNIDEIFKPTKGVFVSVDMDIISYDAVLMPKNYGEFLLKI
ncbi:MULTISPECIES: hypothetical protein [Moraxella]|uniref:Uncharacterized protein n=3 Tax=Moraxella TaxID=475 RepID=A0A378PMD8_9GAMM|nr:MULTISPECIES: hypothetical protein [Moraxella]AKG15999.2 hypothetical protein AAX08_08975 [Moraxella bovoculi]AKG17687.1 hypothetical protein AAX10_08620 [Moraxella bovoculi]ANB92138.1 hypothetical protein MOVS_09320 [Moraxella ovis]STY87913.1 Uncharacterised protein [Moraxella ovis]